MFKLFAYTYHWNIILLVLDNCLTGKGSLRLGKFIREWGFDGFSYEAVAAGGG